MMMGAVACMMLFVTAQPAAAVVYTYDFDGLSPGYIQNQDGWGAWPSPTDSIQVQAAPIGGAPPPGTGLCQTSWGGTSVMWAWRVNDANWSYDLTGSTEFEFGMSFATDYDKGGHYGNGEFYIENNVAGRKMGFGVEILPWYWAPFISNSSGAKTHGGQPRPTARNQVWDFKMYVDTTANGGEGLGYLYSWQRDVHTEWQPITGLQGINLNLLTSGMDVQNSNQLTTMIKTRLVAIDNLWVDDMQAVVIPEPSGLGLVGVAVLALRRRRA